MTALPQPKEQGVTKRMLLAAAFCVAVATIGAGEARAQACGLPDETPALVFNTYVDLLGGLYPLDEAECERIASGALATCHKAVSAEVSCWKQVFKGLAKGTKVGCGAQGPDEAECNEALGDEIGGGEISLEDAELEGHELCEVAADTHYLFCQNPF